MLKEVVESIQENPILSVIENKKLRKEVEITLKNIQAVKDILNIVENLGIDLENNPQLEFSSPKFSIDIEKGAQMLIDENVEEDLAKRLAEEYEEIFINLTKEEIESFLEEKWGDNVEVQFTNRYSFYDIDLNNIDFDKVLTPKEINDYSIFYNAYWEYEEFEEEIEGYLESYEDNPKEYEKLLNREIEKINLLKFKANPKSIERKVKLAILESEKMINDTFKNTQEDYESGLYDFYAVNYA